MIKSAVKETKLSAYTRFTCLPYLKNTCYIPFVDRVYTADLTGQFSIGRRQLFGLGPARVSQLGLDTNFRIFLSCLDVFEKFRKFEEI